MRLPEFVTELSPVRETLEALGAGEARLSADLEEAARQVHVDTADRGLGLFEADFSLADPGEDAARRAAVKAALSGGWGQVNEDFENWTVTAYAAAFGRLPEGAAALDTALACLKPAHLAVEAHPAGVFSLDGGWRSGLTGGVSGALPGDDGVRAGAARRAAPHGGMCRECSGGDVLSGGSDRRTVLEGCVCREISGNDAAGAGMVCRTALAGCVLLEFYAPRFFSAAP